MTGLSTGGETTVLNALLAARYISLHTSDPGNTGAAEVAGGAYARQGPVSFTNSGGNPSTAANTALVQYPTATAAWGTVTHFGIWSAATGGTFFGGAAVVTPKVIDIDDIARWDIGKLTVTAD